MLDTSEKYCLMCEKVYKYLLDPAPDKLGNLWAIKVKDGRKYVYIVSHNFKKPREDERYSNNTYFPLYRQNQLQLILLQEQEHEKCTKAEILRYNFDRLFKMPEILERYSINCGYDGDEFTSMQQLWLVFVMKELFNKIWNGRDWEKII